MKKSVAFRTLASAVILLLALIPFLFISSCQKEEQLIMDSVNQLKSGTISAADIDDLVSKIENYVTSGDLEPGIANSLISKLINAKESLEKGIENATVNQLNAFKNQLGDLIFEETINTSIGEELMFDIKVILGEWTSFVDERDGKEYQTVKIGDQCWMAENLAYLPVVHLSSSGSYTEPCYYVYGYEGTEIVAAKLQTNYLTYGVLYNWPAALIACPSGWHLPTDNEWKQLEMAVGMSQSEADDTGYRGTDEGTKLKATSGWNYDGNGTDDFGFSALPGGYRSIGGFFNNVGYSGIWWSSTDFNTYTAWGRDLHYYFTEVYRYNNDEGYGISVRCVRD